jgi:hypothetical protein
MISSLIKKGSRMWLESLTSLLSYEQLIATGCDALIAVKIL